MASRGQTSASARDTVSSSPSAGYTVGMAGFSEGWLETNQ